MTALSRTVMFRRSSVSSVFDSVSLEHRFAAVLGENIADGERLAGTESISGGETDGADADAPSVTGKEVD